MKVRLNSTLKTKRSRLHPCSTVVESHSLRKPSKTMKPCRRRRRKAIQYILMRSRWRLLPCLCHKVVNTNNSWCEFMTVSRTRTLKWANSFKGWARWIGLLLSKKISNYTKSPWSSITIVALMTLTTTFKRICRMSHANEYLRTSSIWCKLQTGTHSTGWSHSKLSPKMPKASWIR